MYQWEALEFETGDKREFNGSYGFVLLPDKATAERARQLADELAPSAEYKVQIPHITLYHGNLRALPLEKVQELMFFLEPMQGEILGLQGTSIYGGKFLFWDINVTDNLQNAHEVALELSKYVDTEGDISALSEDLDMTEEEFQNAYFYGHPLVKNLYAPHITLAYDSQGLSLPAKRSDEYFAMTVSTFAFAEIGEQGRINKLFDLTNA
jgi:2'-5' RNA ligase